MRKPLKSEKWPHRIGKMIINAATRYTKAASSSSSASARAKSKASGRSNPEMSESFELSEKMPERLRTQIQAWDTNATEVGAVLDD